eukprot:scaffold1881_cov62-Phaeocystis_antarctica.AAC.6
MKETSTATRRAGFGSRDLPDSSIANRLRFKKKVRSVGGVSNAKKPNFNFTAPVYTPLQVIFFAQQLPFQTPHCSLIPSLKSRTEVLRNWLGSNLVLSLLRCRAPCDRHPHLAPLISDTTPTQVRHMSLRAHRAARHACLRHACLHRVCLRRACLRDAYEGKLATFLSLDNNNLQECILQCILKYTCMTHERVDPLCARPVEPRAQTETPQKA